MRDKGDGASRAAGLPDEEIIREVQAFNRERERIRAVLESIGTKKGRNMDRVANFLFIAGLAILVYERFVARQIEDILSLEIGLLLVSIKIIWMIRMQERYNHFLFWIVHSIEFRQTELIERVDELRERLGRPGAGPQ